MDGEAGFGIRLPSERNHGTEWSEAVLFVQYCFSYDSPEAEDAESQESKGSH